MGTQLLRQGHWPRVLVGMCILGRGWCSWEIIQRFEEKEKDALEKVDTEKPDGLQGIAGVLPVADAWPVLRCGRPCVTIYIFKNRIALCSFI